MKKQKTEKWIPAQWTFKSKAVATRFDRHVREQLPFYDLLLDCITHFGAHYIPKNGLVYDVGASTGNVGRRLAPYLLDRKAELVSIEPSLQMTDVAKQIGLPPGRWVVGDCLDLSAENDFKPFDFCVCNLVLMFLPVAQRPAFVRKLRAMVRPGGALVIVDKQLAPPGYLGTVFRRLPMKWKMTSGVTPEEILEKELSLAGQQRPINPHIIPIESRPFFQFGEFTGWIYEKVETGLEEQLHP